MCCCIHFWCPFLWAVAPEMVYHCGESQEKMGAKHSTPVEPKTNFGAAPELSWKTPKNEQKRTTLLWLKSIFRGWHIFVSFVTFMPFTPSYVICAGTRWKCADSFLHAKKGNNKTMIETNHVHRWHMRVPFVLAYLVCNCGNNFYDNFILRHLHTK